MPSRPTSAPPTGKRTKGTFGTEGLATCGARNADFWVEWPSSSQVGRVRQVAAPDKNAMGPLGPHGPDRAPPPRPHAFRGEIQSEALSQEILRYGRGQMSGEPGSNVVLVVEINCKTKDSSWALPSHDHKNYLQYFRSVQEQIPGCKELQGLNVVIAAASVDNVDGINTVNSTTATSVVLDGARIQNSLVLPRRLTKTQVWDRFSREEKNVKDEKNQPSNVSHQGTGPSRLGAFEVHLVQDVWDPKSNCPERCDPSQGHGGPPVPKDGERFGFICTACSLAAKGQTPPSSFSNMDAQYTLLSSKLWSRHWPNIGNLIKQLDVIKGRNDSSLF